MLGSIGKEGVSPAPSLPPTGVQSQKRKAEGDLTGPNEKAIKNTPTKRPSPAPVPTLQYPNGDGKSSTSKKLATQAIPYRGTSKPTTSSTPSPVPTTDPSKQPKKGSYKEIMARAQAAGTQAVPSVGAISHKPKDKTEMSYKKELKLKKKALRDKKLGIVRDASRPSSSDGKTTSPAPGKAVNGKKPPQPSYTGTAKPKPPRPQPSYKGTMNPSAAPKKLDKPKRSTNEYAATDDELDDDDEDEEDEGDGYGYSDEESDDMEAGFSDVEQEETAAARAAKKDDEEEARIEAKLKRDKEERRRRLEAMAKKAKPQRY